MLKSRRGGVTFVELMVGFLIVAITAVAVTSGFYVAHGTLIRERNKMRAVHLLKGELNYWVGRIHSSFPTLEERNGIRRRRVVIARDANGVAITGDLVRHEIKVINNPDTKVEPDWWEIKVSIDYDEPPLEPSFVRNAEKKPVHMELVCPMILAGGA